MGKTYLLQKVKSEVAGECVLHELAFAAHEQLCFEKWFRPDTDVQARTAFIDEVHELSITYLRDCIPVGSIDFVEKVMARSFGIMQLRPINIPLELLTTRFVGRRMAYACGRATFEQLCNDWAVDSIFIKPARELKADYTGVYKKDKLPDIDELVICSEPLDLGGEASEWRVFVYKGAIQDIRCYSGNPWTVPNKDKVQDMISALGGKYPAYTLDVAVTNGGDTVIIELHNFISCGLYGATVPLPMYAAAYQYELSQSALAKLFSPS